MVELVFNRQTIVGTAQFAGGEKAPVFLRVRQKPQLQEQTALHLLQQQGIDAPRVLGILTFAHETVLMQNYVDGVDLAALLPSEKQRPPLPTPVEHWSPCAVDQLEKGVRELGVYLRRQHAIKLPHFGHLVTEDPNPHLRDARLYTFQEGKHALQRCVEVGWVTPASAFRLLSWIERQSSLIQPEEQSCLIHSDLHTGNIRFVKVDDKWQLASIIDYEHAKGWLPEYDLVLLKWHLGEALWMAFLQEYQLGPVLGTRFELFEVIKLLIIMSVRQRDSTYGRWASTMLTSITSDEQEG